SLFEDPIVSLEKLQDLNEQMLKKGLNIEQMNTIRKKLSRVKGGRFADICAPAKVYSIILSDVLGDKIDVIGSGPTVKDSSTVKQALELMERYDLDVDEDTINRIKEAHEGKAENAVNQIVGSVSLLCRQACEEAEKLGYRSLMINDHFDLDYEDARNYIYDLIERYRHAEEKLALILGGEIVVNVKGQGLGGRCQQLAFSQVRHLSGMDNVLFMCVGSDGTDGPTDAAGAYVDGETCGRLLEKGIDPEKILEDNDTYHAFEKIGSLIKTGPTGTNVNDLMLILIEPE
ncbi:MAG: DUF4147 domain-containing protein, partial [Erysipelotrichaceae bacterium]|nr:DUF4147 domain-containing protein [Erysipelotrichaceae bacterium]